jgi:CRP-like cAMP-binding protein
MLAGTKFMAHESDFYGKLSFLNFGELLQVIGSSSATGTLRILSSVTSDTGVIAIEKGNPINASMGSLRGLDALFPLFGWTEGRFEFIQEAVVGERLIKKGRMEIILDGLKLLDEGKIPIQKQPPSRSVIATPLAAEATQRKPDHPPMIKGPIVDYTYVIDEESFYDGDEIIREGSHGNWIWVILEGAAEIRKATPNGPIRLLRVGDGAFLGSLSSFLKSEHVRSTTVVASGNIQLGMLDSQVLTREVVGLSPDFKSLIQSMDNRLGRVTAIGAQAYNRDSSFMRSLQNKKITIEQGQNEERLFSIRAGEVVVARHTTSGYVPLACLEKGDFFGHVPFLTIGHEPYEAAVFSSSDLKLASVDAKKIENEHRRLSGTLRNIIEHLAACISATTLVTINRIRDSGMC